MEIKLTVKNEIQITESDGQTYKAKAATLLEAAFMLAEDFGFAEYSGKPEISRDSEGNQIHFAEFCEKLEPFIWLYFAKQVELRANAIQTDKQHYYRFYEAARLILAEKGIEFGR